MDVLHATQWCCLLLCHTNMFVELKLSSCTSIVKIICVCTCLFCCFILLTMIGN